MKIQSEFEGKTETHKSFAAFCRWADENSIFYTKNNMGGLTGCNTSSVVFQGLNDKKVTIRKTQ